MTEQQTPSTPYCSPCARYLTRIRITPKLGAMPQLDSYRCTGCGEVQTIECKSA
jgi:hypothetical protein